MDNKSKRHVIVAMETAGQLAKNLVGAFLLLVISLSVALFIMAPELMDTFKNSSGWTFIFSGSVLLVVFLIVFPIFLVAQGIYQYRNARALEQTGTLTTGAILEKWVDSSDGRPIYHVLYKYRKSIKALQIVSESMFQKLQCKQSIDVLHLENAPHISRLNFN